MSVLGRAFALFIDCKKLHTAHHSQDVANVAYLIASALGMKEEDKRNIHLAGLLHDLGKGVHFGSNSRIGAKSEDLPIEARLIAAADVYAALASDRPYRRGMDQTVIINVMHDMAKNCHLDKKLVDAVLSLSVSQPNEILNQNGLYPAEV